MAEPGVERTQPRGIACVRRLAVGGEAFPDLIAVAAEGVKGHGDIGIVALALAHEFPVIAEARDESDVVLHPAIGNIAGLDHVDDSEEQERLVRGQAARGRACDVEVGELAEPVLAGRRRHRGLSVK